LPVGTPNSKLEEITGVLLVLGFTTCERKVAALVAAAEPNQLSDELDVTMQEEPPEKGTVKIKRNDKSIR
jgi:hypothetical protein